VRYQYGLEIRTRGGQARKCPYLSLQEGDKDWFYSDKITRIDGDTIYYNASKNESTKGNDARIKDFDTTQELSMKKADLLKYETEQGDEKKTIIWIE
jgi:hypothetical protein